MLRRIDLRGALPTPARLRALVPRPDVDPVRALAGAAALVSEVREGGRAALVAQAERFDGCTPPHVRVPEEAIARAGAALEPTVRLGLETAIERVRRASAAQVPAGSTTRFGDDAVVDQRWQPVDRVGLYVPGGKAVYPSSVVMNAVAAQAAGVPSIAIASPPQADHGGAVHPTILGAASLLGVTEVYAMGGAGAIGALAYGVDELGLDPVDIITGPGNVWVTAAKRTVTGVVGIDSEAGPTEILVIADDSADAALVAADLVSQAEHDELASAVLVTDSPALADRVAAALADLAAATHHAERVRTALSAPQSAIVLVDDREAAAAVANAYAAEHLEIQTRDPREDLARITHAGAIFLGATTPVSLGDYVAGSNHVLPTSGQARFSSGLGAFTFLRPQQVIEYGAAGLRAVAPAVRALADAEGLPAHGDAVDARLR